MEIRSTGSFWTHRRWFTLGVALSACSVDGAGSAGPADVHVSRPDTAVGTTDGGGGAPDAATRADAATLPDAAVSVDSTPGPDALSRDASQRLDASAPADLSLADSAPPVDASPDAAPRLDASAPADLSLADSARPVDASPVDGSPVDASPDAAPPVCTPGETSACLTMCGEGVQVCLAGVWSTCAGPPETCNGLDDDCNGVVDDDLLGGPLTGDCYTGPLGTAGVGECRAGVFECTDGAAGACVGETTPAVEVCDGLDNDCDSGIDEGMPCPARIGNPTWRLGEFTIVSIDYGSAADNYAGFFGLMESLLAPFHRSYPDQALGIGPGLAHRPPYAEELRDALIASGHLPGTTFSRADWQAPRGLVFVATLLPIAGAPVGASPDFAAGPIIRGAIALDGDLLLDGALVDPDFDTVIPDLATLTPRPVGDGYSHIPLFFGENTAFIRGVAGEYAFRLRVTDAQGHGWDARVPFTVTEPIAGEAPVPIESYDLDATPGSGFGCWTHVYSGARQPTVPPRTVGGSVLCSPEGGILFDYRGGDGSLNDGDLGTSHLFVNGRPDAANVPIEPVITLHLPVATALAEIDLHGGWGVLTQVTVEFGGLTETLATSPFGDLTPQGEARHFRLSLSGTTLEGATGDQVVLRGFTSTFMGAPLDQFGLSEIELKRPVAGP
jgi:hypothetical protein